MGRGSSGKEFMVKPERHVFVCINERPSDDPKGCCSAKGSLEIVNALKEKIASRHAVNQIRVTKSGCLGPCEHGINMVVYPEKIWYCGVRLTDLPEIVDSHLFGDQPVARLMIDEKKI